MTSVIGACQARIAALEKALWAGEFSDAALGAYQAAFRQLEQLIAAGGEDRRHRFVIVIPVADRPQHLRSCLDSLLRLCETFGYGGFADGRYRKVSAIIADDSGNDENIARNQEIARHFSAQGIETLYFGLSEQIGQLDALTETEREKLSRILGDSGRRPFYHKGPSVMRNIACLKLNEIGRTAEKILFYFIDSDQEFQVKISTPAGDKNRYAINYLHDLDRIFSTTDTAILTGKVVGDPPVSPAVMAGNFLEDVISFLHRIAAAGPATACRFHDAGQQSVDDGAYHDMAALFGLKPVHAAYQYHCTLKGAHDHARCFSHFSSKLGRFFHGEHPTRKTYYSHEERMAGIRPARTIYTGNYIFRPEGLKYFIPFAALKLRMAGPVLGRLIKSDIGERFVSANLPMLHKRTVRTTGQSEFRPGIKATTSAIDLSGEFERQFYGDVMLFTIEKLTSMGYPDRVLAEAMVAETLAATHQAIQAQYDEKRLSIRERAHALKSLLHERHCWWNQSSGHAEALGHFEAFIANIAHNFSDDAYAMIYSPANKARRHAEIIQAISCYAQDRGAWAEMLADMRRRA